MERRNQPSFDMTAMLQFAICLAALIVDMVIFMRDMIQESIPVYR